MEDASRADKFMALVRQSQANRPAGDEDDANRTQSKLAALGRRA